MTKRITIGLIGNPNCGKSTLLNALTGSRQKVGNWPGVTVSRYEGHLKCHDTDLTLVDLPGLYSLTPSENAPLDEQVARQFLDEGCADVLLNVIDPMAFERSIALTTELLETGKPVLLAVNMMDMAEKQGMNIDLKLLEEKLGVKVIGLSAYRKQGIAELKQALCGAVNSPSANEESEVGQAHFIPSPSGRGARGEGESDAIQTAKARFAFADTLKSECITQAFKPRRSLTQSLDQLVLHKYLGIPIFLGVMYLMFAFAIQFGGALQDQLDTILDMLLIQGGSQLMEAWHLPNTLTALVASGLGMGIKTVLTFIPVLTAMFLAQSFLEESGYMVRAAFVMDRLMRYLGLPGRAFVPLIIGFGCNVPSVMAARTLGHPRDRILTILMSPFMSCSARLAVFTVFVSLFFPSQGHNIVFLLYLIGIGVAVLTGMMLRKSVLSGQPAPLVMPMPAYQVPTWNKLSKNTWNRLKSFLKRASKVIIPVSVILGTLNGLTIHGALNIDAAHQHSLLSVVGQWLTPLFAPMGINQHNWPATVGLLTGTLAKEVVIGTLNTLYTQLGQGSMLVYFSGLSAFAYLLFILLYIPCVATTAATARELNKSWALFSLFWSLLLAYGLAVGFYQLATFAQHPASSAAWLITISLSIFGIIQALKYMNDKGRLNKLTQLALTSTGCATICGGCK